MNMQMRDENWAYKVPLLTFSSARVAREKEDVMPEELATAAALVVAATRGRAKPPATACVCVSS